MQCNNGRRGRGVDERDELHCSCWTGTNAPTYTKRLYCTDEHNRDRVAEHQPVCMSVRQSLQFISLGKIIIPPPTTSSPKDEDDEAASETFNWTKTVDAVRCDPIHRLSFFCSCSFAISTLVCQSIFYCTIVLALSSRWIHSCKVSTISLNPFHLLLISPQVLNLRQRRRDYLFKCLNDEYNVNNNCSGHPPLSHANDSRVNCIMASNSSLCALHNSISVTRINKILFTGGRVRVGRRQSFTALN